MHKYIPVALKPDMQEHLEIALNKLKSNVTNLKEKVFKRKKQYKFAIY